MILHEGSTFFLAKTLGGTFLERGQIIHIKKTLCFTFNAQLLFYKNGKNIVSVFIINNENNNNNAIFSFKLKKETVCQRKREEELVKNIL